MHIAIVANGQLESSLLPDIKQADYIIGVDRAAYWLLQQQVTPAIAIGDFDSTSAIELRKIKDKVKTIQEPAHPKDKTDLEMAVEHSLSLKPDHVGLYGVIGSRLDQTIGAINLLEQFLKTNIGAVIRNTHNNAFLLNSTQKIMQSNKYQYFSVIAHTSEVVVSIRGARYPLDEHLLKRSVSLGLSNEIMGDTAEIVVHSGIALVVQSAD